MKTIHLVTPYLALILVTAGCRSPQVAEPAAPTAPAAPAVAVSAVVKAPEPAKAPSAQPATGTAVVDKDKVIPVPMAEKAVTADGKLDDPAWQKAASLGDFVQGSSNRPDVESRLLVTYDKDNLYLAVICDEPNTDKLKAAATGRDGNVWGDDSIEVYVDANNEKDRPFFGFFVNCKNAVYDRTRDPNWSGEWTSKTSIADGKNWTAELVIPFKTMGITPKAGHKLGIMVARNRVAGAERGKGYFLVPCKKEAKDTASYPVFELK